MRRFGDEGMLIVSVALWFFVDGTLDRRSIKMNLANEGFEARKKDEEVSARKRKAEEDARWEGNVLYPVLASLSYSRQQRTGNSE
jgi:hypothetical protein